MTAVEEASILMQDKANRLRGTIVVGDGKRQKSRGEGGKGVKKNSLSPKHERKRVSHNVHH